MTVRDSQARKEQLVPVSSTHYCASTSGLSTSWSIHGSMIPNLEGGFPLRCFQRLSRPCIATLLHPGAMTGTPEACSPRSSRTRGNSSQVSTPTADRDQTVSRRSEPSSRTTLIGEQPNPWDLLQPQDVMSRHRGAKRFRRYELLGIISLLSPAYLLSVERWPFHRDHRITMTDFRLCSTCQSRSQAGLCHCTLAAGFQPA